MARAEAMIHPTAVVEDGAELAAGVVIGAMAYIGPRVRLGRGSRVQHHATIEGNTVLGEENEVFPYAFVGGRTQDKKWNGDEAPVIIGDRNIFREFCTVHAATFDSGATRIGSDNLFCAYCHVGHESTVGSHCVFSNNATLGGHCEVGDRVVIGGLAAAHQFTRIGEGAMIGGCSRLVQDAMPYMVVEGNSAMHRTFNKVGMLRVGYGDAELLLAKRIYKLFFRSKLNHGQALAALREGQLGQHELIDKVMAFVEGSERGLA